MNRNLFTAFLLVLMLSIMGGVFSQPINEIDAASLAKLGYLQQKSSLFNDVWVQGENLKIQTSQVIQSKVAAMDVYSAYFNENLRCAGLDLSVRAAIVIGSNIACRYPVAIELDFLYRRILYLLYLQKEANFTQEVLNQQQEYNQVLYNQSVVLVRLRTLYEGRVTTLTALYEDCLEEYGSQNNTEPVECEDERLQLEQAKTALQQLVDYITFFEQEFNNSNETIAYIKTAIENITQEYENISTSVEAEVNQTGGVRQICLANRDNIGSLLNTRLAAVINFKKIWDTIRDSIRKIIDNLKKILDEIKKLTQRILQLALGLKA